MTATSVAADPLPLFYLGASYAPTSKEDEALVFQALHPRINKKPHQKRYGTNRTVATPIGKFPSRSPDNRRHDNRCHKPNRSAATAIITATAPASTPTTPTPSTSPLHHEDALDHAFAKLYDDLRAFLHSELKLPMPLTPNPFLAAPTQPTSLPTHSTKHPSIPTTAPRCKPAENN